MSDYHELHFFDAEKFKEDTLDDLIGSLLSCNNIISKRKEPEHILFQTLFNWLPIDLIKKNFKLSTQCALRPASCLLKNSYHSPFPPLNVKFWSGPVATDTVHSNA